MRPNLIPIIAGMLATAGCVCMVLGRGSANGCNAATTYPDADMPALASTTGVHEQAFVPSPASSAITDTAIDVLDGGALDMTFQYLDDKGAVHVFQDRGGQTRACDRGCYTFAMSAGATDGGGTENAIKARFADCLRRCNAPTCAPVTW